MRSSRPRLGLRAATTRLAGDQRGMAAVEFALLAPVMMALCFGGVEVAQAVSLDRMVLLTSGTVSNLVTQCTTISASQQMPDILNASAQVLSPAPVSKAKVVVSLINIDGSGHGTVGWSQTLNGTAKTVGAAFTVPAALATPNTSIVFSEVTYAYTPILDLLKIGTINLYSSTYMYPRASTTINLVS